MAESKKKRNDLRLKMKYEVILASERKPGIPSRKLANLHLTNPAAFVGAKCGWNSEVPLHTVQKKPSMFTSYNVSGAYSVSVRAYSE